MIQTSISTRFSEMAALQDGWLDGEGTAYDKQSLDTIYQITASLIGSGIPQPFVYPSASGTVHFEWTVNSWEVSVDVTPNLNCSLNACNTATQESVTDEFNYFAAFVPLAELFQRIHKSIPLKQMNSFNARDLVTVTIANSAIPATVVSRTTSYTDEPLDEYLVQFCNDVELDTCTFVGVHYVRVPANRVAHRSKSHREQTV